MTRGTILVTGGSCGIGATIAKQLKENGHRVCILSREGAPEYHTSDRRDGVHEDWITADLVDVEQVQMRVDAWLLAVKGNIDGLVMCAVDYGITHRHPMLQSTPEEFERLWSVNTRSQFILLQLLLPALLNRSQAFVLSITSDSALIDAPGRALYAATKAASLAMMRALASELSNTRVSVIQAFPINQVRTRGLEARRPAGYAFSGYATTDIFAPLTLHLSNTLGAQMNGQVLKIDRHGAWSSVTLPTFVS
jgi:short-subunit dehydrogenase